MNWPQITMIVIMALSIGFALAKALVIPRQWSGFLGNLTAAGIHTFLLVQGGFFS
jgi:hypothetical protein